MADENSKYLWCSNNGDETTILQLMGLDYEHQLILTLQKGNQVFYASQ
jgi:hypothetical protein